MDSMGDFYAIALHDDQLRAGLVALHYGNRQHQSACARTLRSAVAAALRALAAVVDAPRPTPAPERPLGAVG
jgi:hypothetical protein